jgi:hypothetical protein
MYYYKACYTTLGIRRTMGTMSADPTIAAATIAALVAVTGFLVAQGAQRRERRHRVFADALAAVRDAQDLPYLVWRRADTTPATVEQLGRIQSEILGRVRFYELLLAIEEPRVARAYQLLQLRTRQQAADHRDLAWQSPLVGSDAPVWSTPDFVWDNGPEFTLCTDAMRVVAAPFPVVHWPAIKRRLVRLEQRDNLGRSATDWFRPLH